MNTKALKQRILSLAISGKLVAQEPNDEPATELLKRLNPNAQPISTTEELPFAIPNSWCYVQLGELCELYTGDSINETEKRLKFTNVAKGRYYIGTKDIEFNHTIIYNNGVKIPEEYTKFRVAKKGSVLLCVEGGSAGRKIAITDVDVCFGNKLCCVNSKLENNKYIYYYLQSSLFTEIFKNSLSGIIGGVSIRSMKSLLLPLPPIAEQKRIVQKIEELFAVIDTIEQNKQQLQNTIKVAKNKILSLAISGKLVAQEPNDEPATELLKRLNPNAQPISTTEELPHGWCKCKLEDVGNIITGSTPPKINNEYYGGNIPFFKPTDLEQGIDTRLSIDHLTEIGFEQSRKLPINTILVTCIGATIGKTGMTAVIGSCNQQINAIVPYAIMFPKYLYYLCISDFVQTQIKNKASATTLPILNKNTFSALEIPLPPIAEQKRIVQKIEELFALLDTLKISSEEQ